KEKDGVPLFLMIIELVNTGTELLLGDVINTNAAWIGQRMAALGLQISRQTVVPDGDAVKQALSEAARRADVLIVTGGLGPTNDDMTREAAAELLGLPLELDDKVVGVLEAFFQQRGRVLTETNKKQAMVVRGAQVLDNPFGTAPGLYIPPACGAEKGLKCAIFLLPGPPRELKPMVEGQVEPQLVRLKPDLAGRKVLYLKVTGMGESDIVDRIEKDLEAMPELELGYCLGRGDVDVRLSGPRETVDAAATLVRGRIGDFIVSDDRRLIEQVVVDMLKARSQSVATAESCTGGDLASRLTNVSGASSVFGHGFITYANEAKSQHLGVEPALLQQHGAVSELVARAMAEGALRVSGADHALSCTGIAGPTGGSEGKPVGTVFIALASKNESTVVRKLFFPGARDRFKMMTTQSALEMLRRRLSGLSIC
ncbi:MAG: CinA-like protein, partial [Verrucomicrobiaceae bacterium]|nr:CinA-like protein [Verrucomicrobiaceae bacterium]